MVTKFRRIATAGLALFILFPNLGNAQDISLATGGADLIWKGSKPNAKAGAWLDLGDLSGDARRDLVAGAPGVAGNTGSVHVIYGGPDRSGEFNLSTADVTITTAETGALFGYATATGNVINADGTNPKNLAIGAPGASGGRGAVYLYTAGWPVGSQLTTADAQYTIIGAPGDQLGSALATGDLDKDGRRELIIGAPGNNRVYIIKGSSSLSGTLNLGTSPAAATITAAGIGNVLIAGDITGDGIYDVMVGAPSQNLVFAYAGTVGAIPTTPVISFSGAAAGDEAGAAIRLLDLDADGISDLVIGAPGGDGPSNSRSNAGNVYAFFGPISAGAHSVNEAQAVFYGAAANYRAGERIATGDINRDTPNDLVILSPGGSSGSGELDIYYGRPRAAIGTPSGPRQVVDFAVSGQVSRRIFGDPAAGAIANAQVYEVTGEGARDVIVGVPAAEGGAGRLYFTISPRLQISRTTETLVTNKGNSATSSTAIAVTNPSVVITGWQATSTAPWLSASPAAGSVVQSSPGAFYVVAQTSTLSGGTYNATLNVTSTSPDLTMTVPIDVTLTVTEARIAIDAPANGATVSNGLTVSGWAIDTSSASGTGVSEVHAYAFPAAGGTPLYLGRATYGIARPDVASAFGAARFTNSGYSLTVGNFTPGASYRLIVFTKSPTTNDFSGSATVNVNVSSSSAPAGATPTDPNAHPPADPNPPITGGGGTTPNANTRVAVNRSALTFGSTDNGNVRSGAQSVTVSFTNGGSTWSVASDAPWLTVSPASGAGSGTFSVAVAPGTYTAGQIRTATLTVTAPGVANSPLTVPVSFTAIGSPSQPIGIVDTPADHATGVVGSIPVTGWAIDDIGVASVTLWRDPMPGEAASSSNGKVFIGNAGPVDGARPDVDATYAAPFDYQAGWGYLLLTNMLPNQGNGTFTLYVYATDVEGHTVLLGSRTITCDNAHATSPFGSIDTPDQGGTVSGAGYINFGWALTPQPNMIPTDGSTITVYVDGVPIGHPVYNQSRSDIATLFPGRANTNGAVGYLQFDTRTLANGVHTIAWGVTDNAGNAAGIGSRYFTVLNGASSSILSSATVTNAVSLFEAPLREAAPSAGESVGQPVSTLEPVPVNDQPTYVQKGFEPGTPLEYVDREIEGSTRVRTEEIGLVRVTVGPPTSYEGDGYEGYMVKGSELAALPAGSFLDKKTGEFFWQPGPGFVGSYDFVFIRTGDGAKTRIPMSVNIGPRKHDNETLLPSRVIK